MSEQALVESRLALGLRDNVAPSVGDAVDQGLPYRGAPQALWPMVRLCHPNSSDWVAAESYAPARRWVTLFAVPVALGLILGGFVAGFFGWSTGLLHLAALYLFVERLVPWLKALEPGGRPPETTRRITVTPETLTVETVFSAALDEADPTTSYAWAELGGYYTYPQGLVIELPARQSLVLSRTWFSPEEFWMLESLVKHHLSPTPPRFAGALRPLLVSVALVGLWVVVAAQF